MRSGKVYFDDMYAGIIYENDDEYIFEYDDEYYLNPNAMSVSLTLPKTQKKYESNTLFSFFDGLIPEGWLLENTVKVWKLDYKDRFGILLKSTEDSIGAVSIKEVNGNE